MSTLYIVATPIGNLEDITLRALRILKEVDLVACEDTRRTRILLDRYEITTPTVSYHQHSRDSKVEWLARELDNGKNIALVSDAGTPGINDPGGQLVAYVRQRLSDRVKIEPIPGANGVATLLSVSGLDADRYLFLGFLPKKKGRQTLLRRLVAVRKDFEIPIVFYESPERIGRSLNDFLEAFGDTNVVVGRELTKQFEEIWTGTLIRAIGHFSEKKPKGEFVVAIT